MMKEYYVQFVDFKKDSRSYGAVKLYPQKEVPQDKKLNYFYPSTAELKTFIVKNLHKGDKVFVEMKQNDKGYYIINKINKTDGNTATNSNENKDQQNNIEYEKSKLINSLIMSIAEAMKSSVAPQDIGKFLSNQVKIAFKELYPLFDKSATNKATTKSSYPKKTKQEDIPYEEEIDEIETEDLDDEANEVVEDDIPF